MRIIGFDSAVENLGVCCIEFDENYKLQIAKCTEELSNILDNIGSMSKKTFINLIHNVLKKLNNVYNNIIKITYINVFDLIPGENINKITVKSTTEKLKYLLHYIDNIFPHVDVVLIEYQMKQNSLTPLISGQIMFYYTELKSVPVTYANNKKGTHMNKSSGGITYGLEEQMLVKTDKIKHVNNQQLKKTNTQETITEKNSNIRVEFVGCGVKNSHKTVSDGDYSNFIERYNINYTANKKHTEYNFLQFIKIMNDEPLMLLEEFFKKRRNVNAKYDDVADAFMMVYGWIVDNYIKK
jgi:hypothetical protein